MKTYSFFLKTLLLFVALLSVDMAWAQCSDKNIRKACKQGLESYIFETASSKPYSSFNASKKTIDAAFSVYAQESYRVINLCEGFPNGVEFMVYDADNKEIFNNGKDVTKSKFDFVAEKSGDYTIRYNFNETDNKLGCVAFAVGYK